MFCEARLVKKLYSSATGRAKKARTKKGRIHKKRKMIFKFNTDDFLTGVIFLF